MRLFPLTFSKNLRKLPAITLLAFSIAACDQLDTKNTQQETSGILDRAESYLSQGQYRAATIEVKNAVQKDPGNTEARIIMARIGLKVGQPKSAIEQLKQIPTPSAESNLLLAEAYIKSKKYYSAEEVLNNEASALKDFNAFKFHILSAENSLGLNRLKESESHLKTASSLVANSPENQTQASLIYSRYYVAKNDIENAKKEIDKALALEKSSEALLQKGALLYKENKLEQAEDLLTNALLELKNTDVITPLRIQILEGLIRILSKSGRSSEALIYSKLLAEATPGAKQNKAKFEEAVKLAQDGNLEEAEAILTKLYASGGSELSGRMLGIINAMQGNLQEADAFLTENVDTETASSQTIGLLAETKLKLNQIEDALNILEQKVSRSPNDATIQSIYGLALASSGQLNKAVDALKKAIKLDPSKVKYRVTLANVQVRQGLYKDAVATLEGARKLDPKDQSVPNALIRLYISTNQLDKAKAIGKKLLAESPTDLFALNVNGLISLAGKEPGKAVKYFEKSLSIDAENLGTRFGLAGAYTRNNQQSEAIKIYEGSIDITPNSPSVYKAFITAHELNKTPQKAINKIAEISKNNLMLWAPDTILAEYHFRNGNLDEAIKHIDTALQRNAVENYPQSVAIAIYFAQANNALNESRYPDARTSLMQGLQIQPTNIKLLALLTTTEILSGQTREASKLIEQIRTEYPESPLSTELTGDLEKQNNNLDSAMQNYLSAWDAKPTDVLGLKIVRLNEKQGKNTLTFLNDWTRKLPSSVQGHLLLAMSQHGSGQVDAAINNYQKVLQLAPNSLIAINNLSWIMFEKGQSGAMELAEKGANLYPNNASMLDTYGWILFKSGKDKNKAREVLKKALDLEPENKDIKKHYDQVK